MKCLKSFPFYPFLFVIYTHLDLLSRNIGELKFSDTIRAGALSLAGAGVLFLASWGATRHFRRAAWISFGITAFFLLGGHLERWARSWLKPENPDALANWTLIGWIALSAVLFSVFAWKIKNWHVFTEFLNLVSLLLLAMPALRLIYGGNAELLRSAEEIVQSPTSPVLENEFPSLDVSFSLSAYETRLPDIYLIVLDGYARQDVLQVMYHLDNQSFISWLQTRGFLVPQESRSNYIQTLFSLTSLFNLDYLDAERIPEDDSGFFRIVGGWLQTSRVLSFIKARGYQVIDIVGGYGYTVLQSADHIYRAFYSLNDYEGLMFTTTSLYRLNEWFDLGFIPSHSYEAHRRRVRFVFETLARIPAQPGPKFVFAHIISPHPPFVFGARGEALESSQPFGWNDGSHYQGTLHEYQSGYRGQVMYINAQLKRVVEAILEHSETPPVIVLLSDHGPGSHLDWESVENTCVWERGSNFMALYLPQGLPAQLHERISSVNMFRVLMDVLFGTQLGMLEDRTYYTPWSKHNLMIDVTDQMQPDERCFNP